MSNEDDDEVLTSMSMGDAQIDLSDNQNILKTAFKFAISESGRVVPEPPVGTELEADNLSSSVDAMTLTSTSDSCKEQEPNPVRVSAVFENKYSAPIILYWEDHSGKPVKICDIAASSKSVITTFATHKFFASTDADISNRAHPYQYIVRDSKKNYIFQRVESIAVVFENKYSNYSISLFYEHHNGSVSKICDIPSNEQIAVNTTTTHVFFACTDSAGKNRVFPPQFVATKSQKKYTFEPEQIEAPRRSNHPLIRYLNTPSNACAAKFRNHIPTTVEIYYENGNGGALQGVLEYGKEYVINVYCNNVLYFTEKDNKSKELGRVTITPEQGLYLIEDASRPASQSMLALAENEKKFMAEYLSRTGVQWRHYYGPTGPRPAPVLYMWPASSIGQLQSVTTPHNYWNGNGQIKGNLNLTLEVISVKPKIFMIANFMSSFEVESIINLAKPSLARSAVGSADGGGTRSSDIRTSNNAWISRSASTLIETLHLRAAHLLKIDEKLLRNNVNAENMQVVHYVNGQKYDAHYDWGVNGYAESRYITLLLYLTDQDNPNAGGETSFPKADGGMGLKVIPKKGTAVLFYNLLEDGNGDDLTLHAALPCTAGEKWLANFWIWDPKRKV